MASQKVTWVRYSWNLDDMDLRLSAPDGYDFNSASSREEQRIIDVVLQAYGSDPIWQTMIADIQDRLTERITNTLGREGSDYIVARNNEEIVAVSGVAREHWTDQHLLTGICVLSGHQR